MKDWGHSSTAECRDCCNSADAGSSPAGFTNHAAGGGEELVFFAPHSAAREWCPRLRPQVLERDLSRRNVELADIASDPGAVRVWPGDSLIIAAVMPRGDYALCWHGGRKSLLLVRLADVRRAGASHFQLQPQSSSPP